MDSTDLFIIWALQRTCQYNGHICVTVWLITYKLFSIAASFISKAYSCSDCWCWRLRGTKWTWRKHIDMVSIHKDDWHLLWIQHQDKYFVYTCLPMGCLFHFNIISDSTNWWLLKGAIAKYFRTWMTLLIAATSSWNCLMIMAFLSAKDRISKKTHGVPGIRTTL